VHIEHTRKYKGRRGNSIWLWHSTWG